MNQAKLIQWIEQAEERAVCDLAKAEPGLLKVWPNPTNVGQSPERAHMIELMSRVAHRFGAVERPRGAA